METSPSVLPTADIKLNPFELLSQSWEIFKSKWSKILSVLVVSVLLQVIGNESLDLVVKSMGQTSVTTMVFSLLLMVFQLYISAGLVYIMLKIVRGLEFGWSDLFSQAHKLWTYFLANLAVGLLVVLGMILLIIPGIYWSLKYWPVMYLIIDKNNLGVREAMSLASKMTDKIKLQILMVYIVLIIINLAGALAFGFGLLITIPLTYLVGGLMYTKLESRLS